VNFKTTLVLAIALIVAAVFFYFTGSRNGATEHPSQAPAELLEEKSVLPADLGNVTKITCKEGDQPEWVFEKQKPETPAAGPEELPAGGPAEWHMTAPLKAKAAGWQVDGIVRRLTQLKYKVKHAAGSAGAPTAAQTGLDPPVCTVTLQVEGGKSYGVQVGRDLSDQETYVRLAGSNDIYVASPSLGKLLKKSAIEYRDQRLLEFQPAQVKKIEITDRPEGGQPTVYTLIRAGTGWTIETPSKASAVTEKINTLAQTISGLRVTEWVESDVNDFLPYGLEDEGLDVHVTTEEPTAEKPDESGEESPTTKPAEEALAPPVVHEFTVHVSYRSPLDEPTKVYVRVGDERAVGTLAKATADRLIPKLAEWQDMRVTTADVTSADRIELATTQGGTTSSAVFTKEQGVWQDAQNGTPIDAKCAGELLDQIKSLKAQNFVPWEGDAAAFGLDQPQATIVLNVPGLPEAERFAVGGYSDPQTRRMVHVRHKESNSVAKVRVADVAKLIRPPAEYRDRTVFDLKPENIEKITLSRQDELTDAQFGFTLARRDGQWTMVQPVQAEVAAEPAKKLAAALGKLRAERVLAEADPAAVGLTDPQVRCQFVYQPPEITKYTEAPVNGGPPAAPPATGSEPSSIESERGRVGPEATSPPAPATSSTTPNDNDDDLANDNSVEATPVSPVPPPGASSEYEAPLESESEKGAGQTPPATPSASDSSQASEPSTGSEPARVGPGDAGAPATSPQAATQPAEKTKTRLKAEKVKPPSQTYDLLVTEHDGKVYARRGDQQTIYELTPDVLATLRAEYRTPELFSFQDSQATAVTAFDNQGRPMTFRKQGDKWQCAASPDLPIDPKKVTNLLLQIKDIKTDRYVALAAGDLSVFGLDQPWRSVTVELEGGATVGLLISERQCGKDKEHRHFAMLEDAAGPASAGSTPASVFLLPSDALTRCTVELAEFETP